MLRQRLSVIPDLLVEINADEPVVYGPVVEIMDATRQAGVASMAIAVKLKRDDRERRPAEFTYI